MSCKGFEFFASVGDFCLEVVEFVFERESGLLGGLNLSALERVIGFEDFVVCFQARVF